MGLKSIVVAGFTGLVVVAATTSFFSVKAFNRLGEQSKQLHALTETVRTLKGEVGAANSERQTLSAELQEIVTEVEKARHDNSMLSAAEYRLSQRVARLNHQLAQAKCQINQLSEQNEELAALTVNVSALAVQNTKGVAELYDISMVAHEQTKQLSDEVADHGWILSHLKPTTVVHQTISSK